MISDDLASVKAAASQLDRWRVPGLQVAAAQGEAVYAGGVGVRGVDDPAAVGPRTLFHHGSCAKAYTALCASVLHERGAVDLDAPVRRWVPELELPDPVVAERVSIRDLLSHRSGIGRHDLTWIFNPSWTRAELVRRLAHLPLAGDMRTEMNYSNLGYALAGLAIERATQSSWEAQLAEVVLGPAGLTRTFTSVETMLGDADHARPHRIDGAGVVPTPMRVLDGIAPAGKLITSAECAARWLQLQLGTLPGAGDAGIAPAAVTRTQQIDVGLPPDLGPVPELRLLGYASGWIVALYRGRQALWHSGGVDGFLTQTMLLPGKAIGVTASANLHFSDLPLAVALSVLDELLDEPRQASWYDQLWSEHEAEPALTPAAAGHAHAHPIEAYAGSYTHAAYGDLDVTVGANALSVRLGETALTASHRHFETWELAYPPLDLRMPLTFRTDAAGAVSAADADLEDDDPAVTFQRRQPDE
jgi:CubicO group peptidase (beta-lactamase class C family)